jgi:hypothetical protein
MDSSLNVSNCRAHLSLLDLTVVLYCGSRLPSEVSKPVRANPGSVVNSASQFPPKIRNSDGANRKSYTLQEMKPDTSSWELATTPFDFQLRAIDIELRPVAFTQLEIDNLMPNQITSCSKIFWYGHWRPSCVFSCQHVALKPRPS